MAVDNADEDFNFECGEEQLLFMLTSYQVNV